MNKEQSEQIHINIDNVSKLYTNNRGEQSIGISNINITVRKGEFIAVVGHSGCGKTTLLHLISGLIQPTTGIIKIDGLTTNDIREDCGFVFQEFSLFPWLTVIENVKFGLEVRGYNYKEREEIATKYLELVKLIHVKNAYINELSGGMKQRVAIARSLAYNPSILLMDEPFGALDDQTREEMQEELINIWKTTKKTIVFVTHSIREAIFLADKIYLMKVPENTISKVYSVPLIRPRDLKTKTSQEVNDLVFEISTELRTKDN